MTDYILRTAEETYGINADPSDAEKLLAHIIKKYGSANPYVIQKAFNTGEAASFLTVNETYFFREPLHFEFLAGLLPSFEDTGIFICSAAASAG
ncbi:MAG: hypothetical protein LBU82_07110, partial [Treponema sp.]|nr:hypothetical protein [Treponema sp.]